jgi:uncharacterized membrane protein YvlD (DUF360 family)
MLELLLIGCFTGFFLAAIRPLLDVLSIFIGIQILNAGFSIMFSAIAVYLVEISTIKDYVLHTIAGAFLGAALLALVERVATYKPAVINSARDE